MNWFRRNYLFVIGGTVSFAVLIFVFIALAQAPDIDRTKAEALIAEKGGPGGCATYDECTNFCDNQSNVETCLDYAEENELMSYDEVQRARRFVEIGFEGPGGCDSEENCRAYCDIPGHMLECLEFALENNLIPPEELEEANKVLTALRAGATPPGGCVNKQECEVYCDNPDYLEECLAFGLAAGFISSEEAEMIRRIGGRGPGGCRGREQCDAYCADPGHNEECINFAVDNGFMSAEEAEMARKTGGKGPGGCKGKEECETFCDNPDNSEECINFAVEHGFMPAEEAEQAKKFMKAGGQGPGGCKGKEECEIYCSNPEHGEECTEFAVKMGFMSQEEADKMKNFVNQGGPGGCKTEEECRAFCENPENQETCFNFGVQQGFIKPEEAEQMRQNQQMMQQGGPGGCKSEQECRAYCDNPDNQKECFEFTEQKGMVPPEQMREMKEQVREGLRMEGMPGELKDCLRSLIGEEFDRIERGESVPGPEFGEFVSECAQKMHPPAGEAGKPIGPPEGQPGPSEGMPEGIPEGGPSEEYPQRSPERMPPEGLPEDYQYRPEDYQMPPEGYPQEQMPERYQSPEGYQQQYPEGYYPQEPESQPEGQSTQPEEYPQQSPEGYQEQPQEFQQPPSEYQTPQESVPQTEGGETGFFQRSIGFLQQTASVLLNALFRLFK